MLAKKLLGAAIVALPILFSAPGCGPEPANTAAEETKGASFASFTDMGGQPVVLEKKPERIVVTSASFLEPLHEVGGDVVGRPDSKTKMPDFAKDKASIGAVYQIDVEKVLACQPDLVLVNKGMNEKLAQTLSGSGVATAIIDMKSYGDVKAALKILAQITGDTAKGDELIADMDSRIKAAQEKMPAAEKRVAILHSTAQGLSVQLDGSIAGSVAKMLGFTNVASGTAPLENNPDAAPYSLETLVEQNPDIIFITSMGKLDEIKANMEQTINASPAWQSLPAIKNGRIYYLPQDLFLLSPGLHYPEAVELMAGLVYPEVFKK